MKQLKFMLAAATAVGIAAAAQAGADAQYDASTGFEEQTVAEDATIGTGSDEYFYYDGNPSDNESKIIAASAPAGMDRRPHGTGYFTGTKVGTSKILQVNTGSEPLLRSIAKFNDAPAPQDLTADTYVDTLVQFTVTPGTDSVDHTEGVDKLMVYLKEMTNGVGTVTGTNLVVKAGYLGAENPAVAIAKEYIVNTGTTAIVPGVWYRLTVKAIPNLATAESMYYPAFEVSINGNPCTFDTAAFDNTANNVIEYVLAVCGETNFTLLGNNSVVFSLCATGTAPASLKGVGFAGEGKVDDLIITTEDPDTPASTGVDFTLALGEGVSAVTWTIAEGGATIYATEEYTGIEPGTYTITNVEYADWYAADGSYVEGSTITVADGQTVTVTARPATAADLGVKNPSGASDDTVNAALAWAKNTAKVTTEAVENADDIVANYLLNVEDLSVEPEIEIVSIDTTKSPVEVTVKVKDANGSAYEKVLDSTTTLNGGVSLKYQAAASLEGLDSADKVDTIPAAEGSQFIRVVVE